VRASVCPVFLPPWLRQVDYGLNLSIRSTSRCPLCLFKVDNDGDIPNSSERDVILVLAVGQLRNVHLFVRTLRTTACRARCVLFVDQKATSGHGQDYFATLYNCGVQLVDLGPGPVAQLGTDFLRQIVYYRFLTINHFCLDRVLVADLFDTIFQKDPFIEAFQSDRVYYSNEGYAIKADYYNRKWMRRLFPWIGVLFGVQNITSAMRLRVFEQTIVNSGLIGGGVKPFLRHANFMVKMGNNMTWRPYCLDQPFLNAGLGLGLMQFPYQIDSLNSTFLGTVGILLAQESNAMTGRGIGSFARNGRIPNVLHQFDRSALMKNSIRDSCPEISS
jgi:hypothetical protein